ncbi:hypothetical protein JB92DRAFT_93336 [Gautieria morchelliformis]|nr:hypothetical protein JB92DRAFT_93336 [Gautieria morchelliformis]
MSVPLLPVASASGVPAIARIVLPAASAAPLDPRPHQCRNPAPGLASQSTPTAHIPGSRSRSHAASPLLLNAGGSPSFLFSTHAVRP